MRFSEPSTPTSDEQIAAKYAEVYRTVIPSILHLRDPETDEPFSPERVEAVFGIPRLYAEEALRLGADTKSRNRARRRQILPRLGRGCSCEDATHKPHRGGPCEVRCDEAEMIIGRSARGGAWELRDGKLALLVEEPDLSKFSRWCRSCGYQELQLGRLRMASKHLLEAEHARRGRP
jgi:hypothetical protein